MQKAKVLKFNVKQPEDWKKTARKIFEETIIGKRLGKADIPNALQMLKGKNYLDKVSGIFALATRNEQHLLEEIVKMLKDPDEFVRKSAADALGGKKAHFAADALIDALADKSRYVRSAAAHALGEIGDKKALPSLTKCLEDDKRNVVVAAENALKKMGQETDCDRKKRKPGPNKSDEAEMRGSIFPGEEYEIRREAIEFNHGPS